MPLRLKDLVQTAKNAIQEVTCEDVEPLKAQGYKLLDVREPAEYLNGTIAGALHIPRGILEPKCDVCFESHEGEMADINQPWIVFCQAGGRGALACYTLQQMGYTNAVNLQGGYQAWLDFKGDTFCPPEENGLMRCDHPWNPFNE